MAISFHFVQKFSRAKEVVATLFNIPDAEYTALQLQPTSVLFIYEKRSRTEKLFSETRFCSVRMTFPASDWHIVSITVPSPSFSRDSKSFLCTRPSSCRVFCITSVTKLIIYFTMITRRGSGYQN